MQCRNTTAINALRNTKCNAKPRWITDDFTIIGITIKKGFRLGQLWLRGGASVLLSEGRWFDFPGLHVKVSLGKILNTKLLLMCPKFNCNEKSQNSLKIREVQVSKYGLRLHVRDTFGKHKEYMKWKRVCLLRSLQNRLLHIGYYLCTKGHLLESMNIPRTFNEDWQLAIIFWNITSW